MKTEKTMSYEDALRKVQACLRLSKSSNPAEAALAAAKAQEIMDKYNIEVAATQEQAPKGAPVEEVMSDHNCVITSCRNDRVWGDPSRS